MWSVVSTLLVVSAVMLVAVVLIMGTALSDSDQPATIRFRTRRAGRKTRARRQGRRKVATQGAAAARTPVAIAVPAEPAAAMDQASAPAAVTVERPASAEAPPVAAVPPMASTDVPTPRAEGTILVETPDVDRPSRRRGPLTPPPAGGPSHWVRSGFALLLMIAFLGTLVAMAVGTAVALIAQALKHAVS